MTKKNHTRTKHKSGPDKPVEQLPFKPFPIVGIGASAGGLAALKKFFSACPPDSGMAFVVVTHLDPSHESLLPELLTRYTQMKFYQVDERMQVEPDCVYVIPPNRALKLENGYLYTLALNESRRARYPIDVFLRSLASEWAEQAVCVILSGTGTDGTLGLQAIKEGGGLTIAQEEISAEYAGMPQSAARTGQVDLILPAEKIPAKLMDFINHKARLVQNTVKSGPNQELHDLLPKIFHKLHSLTGHDFSSYKQNTVLRRIERRMAFQGFDQASSYYRHLQNSPGEASALMNDLLIGVTSFFRDPRAFVVLGKKVLTPLIARKAAQEPIRIWVAGCGSGEEAYSIAMLLQENLDMAGKDLPVQIFATDLDKEAIDIARNGVYPRSIAADISAERLQKFFNDRDGAYHIYTQLCERVIFATHNLIQDPPFFKLDLICCRNLLIYINAELQKNILSLFGYALHPQAFLFLGPSESIGVTEDLFEPVDKKWKIFQRRTVVQPNRANFPLAFPPGPPLEQPMLGEFLNGKINVGAIAEKALLQKHSPPCVVVNEEYEVVHFSTRTSKLLEPPVGEPTLNILRLAREELRAPLRVMIHKAFTEQQTAVSKGLKVRDDDEERIINLTVEPLMEPLSAHGLALVILQEVDREPGPGEGYEESQTTSSEHLVRQLEGELNRTSEQLRITIEETESANEELKASNEELMSMNEELQSTNEELETSKEELSALNEELMSVNSELQNKMLELEEANSDILNLFSCTEIATIFLDRQLRVKRFTPAISDIFSLMQTDIGRPLQHLAGKVDTPSLIEDAQKAIKTLKGTEREVPGSDGQWFLMRILPYRTVKDVIAGVVINFIDISSRKQIEQISKANETRLQALMNLFQSTDDSFDHICGTVLDNAMAITHSGFGLVLLQNALQETSLAGMSLMKGGSPQLAINWPDQGQKLWSAICTQPRPMTLSNRVEINPLLDCLPQGLEPVERMTIVPIMDQEKVRAVILMGNKAHDYDTEDLRQITLFLGGLWALIMRKHASEVILNSRESAEKATREKSDFLANMSHEIRTPLTGVIGWIELACSLPELTGDQRHHLEMARKSSILLKAVLDGILDFSKIDSNSLKFKRAAFSLRSCINSAVGLYSAMATGQGLSLNVDIAAEVPEIVIGDEVYLLKVLANLIANAIKFTSEGKVEIKVSVAATDLEHPEKTSVCFAIRDSGIGIPENQIDQLFHSFRQADNSMSREYGGTGLGLYLCKRTVEAMGGKIWVLSEVDRGSEFTFTIPFEIANSAISEQTRITLNSDMPGDLGLRILLVEDDHSIANLFQRLLSNKGCEVIIANNGQEAVDIWQKGSFDLILMDLQMPKMNGFDTTRIIRDHEKESGAHIPIIALTAHIREEDEIHCKEAGMDAYMSKLADTEDLYDIVWKMAQATRENP